MKLSDLDDGTKKVFVNELNMYIYENSLFNRMFPLLLFAYIFFIIFICVHWLFEKLQIYEADLEMAKIEQHLIKYYSDDSWWIKVKNVFASNTDENAQATRVKRKRQYINSFTWRPFYWLYDCIFGKSKVELALERIKQKFEFEQMKNL